MKMCMHAQRKLAAASAGAGAVFWNNPSPFRHLRFHVNSRKQCLPGTIPDIPTSCWPPCQCDNNVGWKQACPNSYFVKAYRFGRKAQAEDVLSLL